MKVGRAECGVRNSVAGNTRLFILAFALVAAFSLSALGGEPEQGTSAELIASYERAIDEAKDERRAALLRKQLGDYHVAQGNYASAAKQYVKVISLDPSPFSAPERFEMAVHLSWADRLDESASVLLQLLDEDPADSGVRVQLAKVLSWSNHLKEAAAEADRVLADDPANQEALLVKANALRWQGRAGESVPLYQQALDQGEYFDARLGLGYAFIDLRNEAAAREQSGMLEPVYPRQELDVRKLEEGLCTARSGRPGFQYSHYGDSDDNRVNRYSLYYGYAVAQWDSEVRYGFIDADDLVRGQNGQELSVRTSHRQRALTIGAGLGVTSAEGNRLTGFGKLDLDLGSGTAGIAVARDALTDTAQLMENQITRNMATMSLSQRATNDLSFAESYAHAGYSDDNAADDLRLAARYSILKGTPKIDLGYRFRSWDFRRSSGGGYFDPQHFIVHQLFLSLNTEYNGFYAFAEPYAGFQSFTRYGEKSSGTMSGIYASVGWGAKSCTSFELFGEGGNYAGATAAGFTYYLVGFKVSLFM